VSWVRIDYEQVTTIEYPPDSLTAIVTLVIYDEEGNPSLQLAEVELLGSFDGCRY